MKRRILFFGIILMLLTSLTMFVSCQLIGFITNNSVSTTDSSTVIASIDSVKEVDSDEPSESQVASVDVDYSASAGTSDSASEQTPTETMWSEWEETISPTCTQNGVRTRYDLNDSAHTETIIIEKLDHELVHHDGKAATCTEKGWKAYDTCSRCDYTTYEEIAALDHELVHHDGKAAICTEKGWKAYDTCSRCDYSTYEEIAALGHIYNATVTAPTCTAQGYTTYVCSRCGDQYVSDYVIATGHTYAAEWTYDDDFHWHEGICGHNVKGNRAKHDWQEDMTQHVDATFDTEGFASYYCPTCGHIKEEIIPILKMNTVVFYDADNNILDTQKVVSGQTVVAPYPPEKEGYRFAGWDVSFENVQSDLNIHAVYVKVFTVEFIDYDGSFFAIEEIDSGEYVRAPETDPTRASFAFDGWYLDNVKLDRNFSIKVESDMSIKAKYIRQYTVTFVDYDGTVLKTEKVNEGASVITLPAAPERTGYTFSGWDKPATDITSDTTIIAQYDIDYYTVRFLMPDNRVLKTESVAYGHYAEEPVGYDEIFFTWNKKISGYDNNTAYRDPEWDKDFDNIVEDTDVKLVYKTKITETVIIMDCEPISVAEVNKGDKANVIFYIYSPSETVYSLSLDIDYKAYNSKGELVNYISLNDEYVDDNKKDDYVNIVEQNGYNNNFSETIDINEKTIEFVWASNGGGNTLGSGNNAIIRVLFTVEPNTPAGDYYIRISPSTYYINGNMDKVYPVIISGKITVTD